MLLDIMPVSLYYTATLLQILTLQAQADPSKAENWVNYRKQRNYVTALCRKTEAQYWKTKFEQTDNPASF